MGFFRKQKQKEKLPVVLYTWKQELQLETYIKQAFGPIWKVWKDDEEEGGVQIQIAVIAPSEKTPYYQLVTMGMGAFSMKIPEEYEAYGLERAELVLCLPASWKIESTEEQWIWPIRWMREIAKLPQKNKTWLGLGHTIEKEKGVTAVSTEAAFSGFLLTNARNQKKQIPELTLEDGSIINFYQLLSLYPEEIKIAKHAECIDDVLERFEKAEDRWMVNPGRPNYGKEKEKIKEG